MARREVHTDDMDTRDIGDVTLPAQGVIMREAEAIALPDGPVENDQLKNLAFNEEVMTIRLERSSEKNAPHFHDFHVNGVTEWVPVGQPYKIKRKFVEVIARSQPYDVQTEVIEEPGRDPFNRVIRNSRSKYPFSVIHDPNPKGFAWLTNIMQSA